MSKRRGSRWLPVGGLLILGLTGLGPVDTGRGGWGGAAAWADDEEPRPIPSAVPAEDPPASLLAPQTSTSPLGYEDKPFYKSTVFWIVTGALVGGAIGLGIYAASHGSPANLGPCPSTANLGCFGAGR